MSSVFGTGGPRNFGEITLRANIYDKKSKKSYVEVEITSCDVTTQWALSVTSMLFETLVEIKCQLRRSPNPSIKTAKHFLT